MISFESLLAKIFSMSYETWQRHTNPWSVWTRFTVLPLFLLAIWSRQWIGWWSSALILITVVWGWLNPRIFPKPDSINNWASKSVFGEKIWMDRKHNIIPAHHRILPNILSVITALGLPFLCWGLWQFETWPIIVGCLLVYMGKLWFLDRMVWLYEDMIYLNSENGDNA